MFKYLLTDNEKCDAGTRRRFETAKDAFEKLSKRGSCKENSNKF